MGKLILVMLQQSTLMRGRRWRYIIFLLKNYNIVIVDVLQLPIKIENLIGRFPIKIKTELKYHIYYVGKSRLHQTIRYLISVLI